MLLSPLLTLLLVFNIALCAKILGIFPIPSLSHQIVFQPIWKELSLRGHRVTVITPSPLNDPNLTNLTEIDVGSTYEIFRRADLPKNMAKDNWAVNMVLWIFSLSEELVLEILKATKPLLENPAIKFDLIIAEVHTPLVYIFGGRFNAPVVGVSSMELPYETHDAVGNPTHPVISPGANFKDDKNLFSELTSFLQNIWYRILYYWYILPRMNKISRKFVHECPSVSQLERNLSFILMSRNLALHPVRPNVLNMVEMGQIHVDTKIKKLPEDLQNHLDLSTRGVIYFSLGTNFRSVDLPLRVRGVIIEALSELPYQVLWKWENDSLPNKPENVMIKKWFPQQEILGHRNVKAFITQGGLQSIEEAITNCVPMIGVPLFGDQLSNVMKIVNQGIGRGIDHVVMTKEELKETILDVAENKTYRERIKKVKKIFSDQPMDTLKKSIWWIEYVLRHKGAPHLRSATADLLWFEYYFVDVIGLLLIILSAFSLFLFFVF